MRNENHRKVEAVLFAVGKDIALEDVARLCDLQENKTKKLLHDLREEYSANSESALMLHEKGKFWKFTVKDTYLPLVTSLVQNTELDKSVMETLAVIAWRYPIVQADLVKIRHNKAYEHLKMLKEREFITKERTGRTYKIKLTPKFFEYFDLPSQDAKEAFKKVIPPEIQEEIQHAEEEIKAKEKKIEEKAEKDREERKEKKGKEGKKKGKEGESEETPEKTEEEKAKEAADELDNE